jgi:exopolysaccharide production protein ExoY
MLTIGSLDAPSQQTVGEAYLGQAGASADTIRRMPLTQPLPCLCKRAFDIVAGALLLVCLLPLMLVAALNVRRDGGPALYTQQRVGRDGRSFGCIKFRSMHVDADRLLAGLLASDPAAAAEWEATHKLRRDPRVTSTGVALRTTSLDELPQLINVLRGEMSLIGPRPIVPSELSRYGLQADLYMMVKPGLTGLWQVSGRSDTTYQKRVRLDCDYIERWSFLLDISILLKTVPAILFRCGAV